MIVYVEWGGYALLVGRCCRNVWLVGWVCRVAPSLWYRPRLSRGVGRMCHVVKVTRVSGYGVLARCGQATSYLPSISFIFFFSVCWYFISLILFSIKYVDSYR